MTNLVALLAALVVAGFTSKGDAQTTQGGWAATACINMPRAGSNATNEARGDFYRPEAGLENMTSNFAYVGCDVGTARSASRVYVDFMDANPEHAISCWLYAVAWNGAKSQLGAQASIVRNGVGYRSFLMFTVPPTSQGHLILTCQLPPTTSILGWNSTPAE